MTAADPDHGFDRAFLNLYQGLPGVFGDPDGQRADLADFIEIAELRRSAFFSPDSRRIRVVVGRKGSGKTFYLKHLKSEFSQEPSLEILGDVGPPPLIAEAEQTQLFGTTHVIRVAHWCTADILTEVWQQLWGRAIALSVASHLLFNDRLRDYLTDEEAKLLRTDFRVLLKGLGQDPRSPFTTARSLIDDAKNGEQFRRSLDRPLWDDLESRIAKLLQTAPPVYLFLDAVDEEFTNAPLYWLRCQKGLFYETMRLLRHTRLGSRLHVVISVRDLVLYSVFRSEHASRYIGDLHLRVLGWNFEAAKALLDAKISRLPVEHWRGSVAPADLGEWLGFRTVDNSFGTNEDVYTYALRHTQCLPRDVVLLGNYLGRALDEVDIANRTFTPELFKSEVSSLARVSALQQLEIVANQLRADEIPVEASDHDFIESFLSIQEYADTRASQVIDLIATCGELRIDRARFLDFQEKAREELRAPDLGSVLWQAGLIGYSDADTGRDVFFSFDKMGRFNLPVTAGEYVFHPSMREAAGLRASQRPVLWHG